MTVPMSVLKLTVGIPAVVASCLLWVIALALMPPAVALLAFLAGVAVLVLFAVGVGECTAVRLLCASRSATPTEEQALAPLAARLAILGIARGREVLIRSRVGPRTPHAQLVGGGALVVTPWMVEAPARGRLSLDEAVAMVVHADARHRAENPRAEVLMLAMTLPYRVILAIIAAGVANAASWVPFLRFAWSVRGVVGVVTVAQQSAEGRPLLGVFAGTVVALSYLVPAASRAMAARVEAAADAAVVEHGLGPVLAHMLRRYRLPVTPERSLRLGESRPPEPRTADRPRLALVRG